MRIAPLLLAAALVMAAPRAFAGGGPETTVVVVNADSPVSQRVANDYAQRRNLPGNHLVALRGIPTLRIVSADVFRERLWKPLKQALEQRGLLASTDLIAWSADFPFAVDVSEDAKAAGLEPTPNVPFRAALTSMTYYWRKVEAKDARGYLDLNGNRYFGRDGGPVSAGGARLSAEEQGLARTAEQALSKKDYAAARDAYAKLLESNPLLVVAWYNLACCHARLGDLKAALDALAEAVDKGWANATDTAADSDLAPLKGEKEFQDLLERMREKARAVKGPQGFSSRHAWAAGGDVDASAAEDSTDRYVLSVMLGYTGEWGNSAREVLTCLERGRASDGARPQGTVYLCRSEDQARTGPRAGFFDGTVAALERLGRRARILSKGDEGQDGALPKNCDDVIGAVLGVAGFTWKDSGSTMLPGAIVEHLTSFGADFSHGGQTKLTEAIRGGAAGSCGTVAEPLNYWMKFPVPAMHVHYAAGCSLAEAFFRSLAGPWQTLVVGDPLARPYARFARVEVAAPAAAVTGQVEVAARVTPAEGTSVSLLELWVDGLRRAQGPADRALAWDTTQEDDGPHELRVVAVEDGAVETRSTGSATFTVSNAGRSVTLTAGKGPLDLDDTLALTGKVAGAKEVDLLAGGEVLATVPAKSGAFKAEVPAARLGIGSVPVVARARFAEGPAAVSPALVLAIAPPEAGKPTKAAKPAKAVKPAKPGKDAKDAKPPPAPAGSKAGLKLTVTDGQGKAHEGSLGELTTDALRKALEALKVTEAKEIVLEGEVQVASDGLYQLVLQASGGVEVLWGGRDALSVKDATADRLVFACATLKAGWSALRIALKPAGAPTLAALLSGDQVAVPLGGAALRQ